MTLPNSITSLIQYQPPNPSSIVLERFYWIEQLLHAYILSRRLGVGSLVYGGGPGGYDDFVFLGCARQFLSGFLGLIYDFVNHFLGACPLAWIVIYNLKIKN